MAKKSREYWEERFAALEEAQSKRGAEYFAELEKQYNRASASVQRDIERWYTRFAVNNEITLQEARKLLTGSDLEEFHWNVMEYIEKGRTLNYSTQWARQLENASARVHVSRLEALKLQMQNHVEVLYGNEMDDFAEEMKKIYTEGYYHTAYEIQKGFNIGYDLMRLDTNKIEKVISRPWAADGSNFSDRIWKQKSQLVSDLHNNLTQAIIRGQNPHVVTEAIARRFNVSKGQAGRLVMTESAFFNSASNYDCYKDLGVEQYEILATLDTKTSDICRALDGKVFDMKDYAAGVTAPPFHVWCRTTTVPYFDDEFELDTQRAARDENGKTYFVPADLKYNQWKNAFVDGNVDDYERKIVQKLKAQGIANPAQSSRIKVTKQGGLFEPATTISEADDYAKNVLKIPQASYAGMDLDIANEWNFGLRDSFDRFPELQKNFGFVGNAHERNRLIEPVARQYYTDWYIQNNPNKSMSALQPYIDDAVNNLINNSLRVSQTNIAQSWTPKTAAFSDFRGVTINGSVRATYDEFIEMVEENVESQFHPIGTGTVRAQLDHEIGHQLDDLLGIRNIDEIQELFDSRTHDELTEELSRYAWKNNNSNRYAEMIAEAWSEYCNNPNPREIATIIGETIEEEYKKKFGGTP